MASKEKISIDLTGDNPNREIPHPDNFPARLRPRARIVLLSSDLSISDANISNWKKSGANFLSARPETCLFPQFIQKISDGDEHVAIHTIPNLAESF
jgi:hypothetical protein